MPLFFPTPMNKKLFDRKYKVNRTLVQTKKGVVAYYFRDGKRIPASKGRPKWIQQNFEALNKPYARQQPDFTPEEASSFKNSKAQRNLFTYKGKKIKKVITELLKLFGDLKDTDPRDIDKIVDETGKKRFKNYGQLEQLFNTRVSKLKKETLTAESMLGAEGHRGREQTESIFDIMESLSIIGVENWKVVVIDANGNIVKGKDKETGKNAAIQAIQKWETKMLEAGVEVNKNIAAMRFIHNLEYDFKTKTIWIDLRASKDIAMYSV